jgi:hypothetical protein
MHAIVKDLRHIILHICALHFFGFPGLATIRAELTVLMKSEKILMDERIMTIYM